MNDNANIDDEPDWHQVVAELVAKNQAAERSISRGELQVIENIDRGNLKAVLSMSMLFWVKFRANRNTFLKDRGKFLVMLKKCKVCCAQVTSTKHQNEYISLIREVEEAYDRRLKSFEDSRRLEAEKLAWELLPPGEMTYERLDDAIKKSKMDREAGFNRSRLDCAHELKPNKIYVGQNEFSGYFVFLYPWTSKVLLENPYYGNAAYIFSDSWEALSRLSKASLLTYHADQVAKLVHRKSPTAWKSDLQKALFNSTVKISNDAV